MKKQKAKTYITITLIIAALTEIKAVKSAVTEWRKS